MTDSSRSQRNAVLLLALMIAVVMSVFWLLERSNRRAASDPATRTALMISVNDIYRIEGVDEGTAGGLARIRTLRQEFELDHPDLLLLHAGDFLFPSLLSDRYGGAQMIDAMNHLDGSDAEDDRMLITFGNHEFEEDKLAEAPLLQARIAESQFRWLGTDITWRQDAAGQDLVRADNLLRKVLIDSGDIRFGLFSLTTEERFPAYIERFENQVETARRATRELRADGAEVVIGLTHLPIAQDRALLEQLGDAGPDLIFGGHEHQRHEERANGRWILKADADGRSAVVATITLDRGGQLGIRHEFRELDRTIEPEPGLQKVVDGWIARHQREFCDEEGLPAGCLDVVVGETAVRLRAEETEIRRFETNLGNWVADRAREIFPKADAAIINAGSLRLNQDIPAGPIRFRALDELFAYPNKLVAIEMDGAILKQALQRSVEEWTGSGAFLQVSGIAFRFDPERQPAERVSGVTLLESGQPITDEQQLTVVTWDFLHGGGDDYLMLEGLPAETSPIDMATHLRRLLEDTESAIAPQVEGRICNTQRPGPCLAVGAPSSAEDGP